MAGREAHRHTLSLGAVALAAGHVVGGPDRLDEGKEVGFEIDLVVESLPALHQGRSPSAPMAQI